MKNETIMKINKLGKAGYIICKIGKIALSIAVVVCIIVGVLMCFVPKDATKIELTSSNSAVIYIDSDFELAGYFDFDAGEGVFEIGDESYEILTDDTQIPQSITSVFYISNIKWICFASAVVCISLFFVLFFAEKLCAYFKDCETPFSEEISNQLTKLVWSLIPACFLISLAPSFSESLIMGKFNMKLEINLVTILLILFVFMLSYIFKHGAALQTESDELL